MSKLDLYRKLEMPKDESRRRVKERLRPYVKVWSPRKGFLNCSVVTVFIAGSSCLWFDWQAADPGSQQEVYRWTFLGQSVLFWKSNINNNNCTKGDKYEVNCKWSCFSTIDILPGLTQTALWTTICSGATRCLALWRRCSPTTTSPCSNITRQPGVCSCWSYLLDVQQH